MTETRLKSLGNSVQQTLHTGLPEKQTAGNSGFACSGSFVWKYFCWNIVFIVWNAHLAEEWVFLGNPSCSRRFSRLEPSYSATHTCSVAHWACILYENNLFSILYNSKTASPQRNEKAGLLIHHTILHRAIRLLLSEVGGDSNSFRQAEVVRKLVCTLLDKCLGS